MDLTNNDAVVVVELIFLVKKLYASVKKVERCVGGTDRLGFSSGFSM